LNAVTVGATMKDEELQLLGERLHALAGNARQGLPAPVFRLISSLTPLVNVDLLIRDDAGRTLLTWRADEFYGPGWHIPGGIVRFKESTASRIAAVAASELGCAVDTNPAPLALREITNPQRDVRGHFISLLFACRLASPPDPILKFGAGEPKNGEWMWHDRCPDRLIQVHQAYRPWIDGSASPGFTCLTA